MDKTNSGWANYLLAFASFVVVVAGMKAASELLVPFFLALFIAIICMPFLAWLRRVRVPNFLAVIIVVVGVIVIGFGVATFVGGSIASFVNEMPKYQASLTEKTDGVFKFLHGFGVDASVSSVASLVNPNALMSLMANTLSGFGKVLSDAFIILLTVIFILLEAAGFSEKLKRAVGDPEKSIKRFDSIAHSVNRYLALKTIISFSTGIIITFWLWIVGVDYPFLWGFLAFLFNYIPNIGSIIAAIPAVLLAYVQLGLWPAVFAAIGYVVVNGIVGGVVEPKVMGEKLGLSTLIVFLSLIFWGWIFGPVGMFLSVPLTVIVRIILESGERTKRIAVLIG